MYSVHNIFAIGRPALYWAHQGAHELQHTTPAGERNSGGELTYYYEWARVITAWMSFTLAMGGLAACCALLVGDGGPLFIAANVLAFACTNGCIGAIIFNPGPTSARTRLIGVVSLILTSLFCTQLTVMISGVALKEFGGHAFFFTVYIFNAALLALFRALREVFVFRRKRISIAELMTAMSLTCAYLAVASRATEQMPAWELLGHAFSAAMLSLLPASVSFLCPVMFKQDTLGYRFTAALILLSFLMMAVPGGFLVLILTVPAFLQILTMQIWVEYVRDDIPKSCPDVDASGTPLEGEQDGAAASTRQPDHALSLSDLLENRPQG